MDHAPFMRVLQRLDICFEIAIASSRGSGPAAMRSASVGPSMSARTNPRESSESTIP